MNLDSIKNRDRWTCKKCGHKFGDLKVLRFEPNNYITLCDSCLRWAFDNKEASVELFRTLLLHTKIVFIGDCHGRLDKLDSILKAEDPFDIFVSVGDFVTLDDMSNKENSEILTKWGSRGYFVKGNHDDIDCVKRLELNQEIRGIKVSALNGVIRNKTFLKETHNNISFREVMYLSHLDDMDILVTHQAPTGVFNGVGEPVLEELLNYLVPKIYVFGHVHKFRFKFHLNTFVISLPIITKGYATAYFHGRDLRNLELVFKRGKKFIRV